VSGSLGRRGAGVARTGPAAAGAGALARAAPGSSAAQASGSGSGDAGGAERADVGCAGAGGRSRCVRAPWVNDGDVLGLFPRDHLCRRAAAAHARRGPRKHAAQAYTDGAEARQGWSTRGPSNRRRRRSCARQRRAER
jgi:hypothetical protein